MVHTLSGKNGHEGVILIVATMVFVAAVLLALPMAMVSVAGSTAIRETEQTVNCDYVTQAAVNSAFAEIVSQLDPTGYGTGAMGLTTPMVYTDSAGNPIAEFKTIVKQQGDDNIILAVAGVPSLSNPDSLRAVERVVKIEPNFLLKPKPAAISIAGPLVSGPFAEDKFPGFGTDDLIDGGQYPAIALSNEDAYEAVMSHLGDRMYDNNITGDELQGGVTSTYEHSQAGEITLPVLEQEYTAFSAETLNEYRNSLRSAVLGLASSADRVVTDTVLGDQIWGTSVNPEVTVIEAEQIGKDDVFGTDGQTVTGHGTLVIKHTLRPGRDGNNLNLNWDGDVYVLGFDGDGSDLLYLHGTVGTINGNLILLSSDNTEASLELADSSGRASDLTVNGALLALAEATSHEAEVEVEDNSSISVNGLMGLYGSRIEIEASDSGTSMTINGTLGIGMAQDLEDEIGRNDDFEIEMDGTVTIRYDEDMVDDAVQNLAELQVDLGLLGDDSVISYDVKLTGGFSSHKYAPDALVEFATIINANGLTDVGFQPPSSN